MTPYVNVFLNILSDTKSPEEISDFLGITCDELKRKGEPIPLTNPQKLYEIHKWRINSNLDESHLDVIDHIKDLLHKIPDTITGKIKELSKDHEVYLTIGSVSHESHPYLFFEADMIQKIADMGAILDLDLYIFPQNEDESS